MGLGGFLGSYFFDIPGDYIWAFALFEFQAFKSFPTLLFTLYISKKQS